MNEKQNILEILLYLLKNEREMNINLDNKCFYLTDEAFSELLAIDCFTPYNYLKENDGSKAMSKVLGLPIKIDNDIVFAEIR